MPTPNTMRAAQFRRYGGPDVITTRTVPTPKPGPGTMLVKVGATSVNGGELFFRAGRLRLISGRHFPKGLGMDFAGTVEQLGTGVTDFAVGDRVWGVLNSRNIVLKQAGTGAAAEYVTVDPRRAAPLPNRLTDIEAVALLAGTTALTGLRDRARLQPGETVLVRGGTGGVGYVAVQLAKALGAHVTTLVSAGNVQTARDLGADIALDYRQTLAAELPRFDVIFDTVGHRMHDYQRLLTSTGRMVSITAVPIGRGIATILLSARHGQRRIRTFSGNPTRALLTDYGTYIDAGDLRPLVSSVHLLDRTADAHRAIEEQGSRGKTIVQIRG